MTATSTPPAGPSSPPDVPPRTARALLADRIFGPYVTGQWLTNTGNWFHNLAAGIVVFELTGSNTLVGVVGGLQFLFTLLLSPFAGQLSDRLDRRRLLLGAQLVGLAGAASLAVIALSIGLDGTAGVVVVLVATAVIGIGYAVSIPTIQAYVPSLVPRRDLPQAIALNSVTFNLARAVGPGLAGLLVAAVGAGLSFGVNALSFGIFAAVLVWLGGQQLRPAEAEAETREHGADVDEDEDAEQDRSILAGLRLARHDRTIMTVLLASAAMGFATDPYSTLAPALADRLSQPEWVVGGIGSAYGAGAFASSFLVSRLRRVLGPRTQAIAGLLVLGAGTLAAGLAPNVVLLLAGSAVGGAGFIHTISSLNTTLQLHVDDAVRGRVMALWSMAFLGVRPIASTMDGSIADLAGTPVAMAVAAALAVIAAFALFITRQRPSSATG